MSPLYLKRRRPDRFIGYVETQVPDVPVGWKLITNPHMPINKVIQDTNSKSMYINPSDVHKLPTKTDYMRVYSKTIKVRRWRSK